MSRIFQLPKQVPIVGGTVSPGAKAHFYLTGTTTNTNTYTDSALTTPSSNPVIADAAGVFAVIYLDPDIIYKLVLNNSTDSLIYEGDPIQDALTQANIGAVLYPVVSGGAEESAGVTPINKYLEYCNPMRQNVVGDGSTNDATTWGNVIAVGAQGQGISTCDVYTSRIATGLTMLDGLVHWDAPSVTLTQANSDDIATLVTFSALSADNRYRICRMRVDGNKANNTAVVGYLINGTQAGDRIQYDLAGINCDTLFKITGENENADFDIHSRDCGVVVQVDTATATPDENRFYIAARSSGTVFKTSDDAKSSGIVDLLAENTTSWAVDITNGVYTLSGKARGCGSVDGGGVIIRQGAGGSTQINFNNLHLGSATAPDNATWGLLCDNTLAYLRGNLSLISGSFDGGVWIKTCFKGTDLDLNVTSTPANEGAVKLGDNAGGKTVGDCTFRINWISSATTFYGINLDQAVGNLIELLNDGIGAAGAVVISNNSSDNTIICSKQIAENSVITNSRTADDNVVKCLGSYAISELAGINGGNPFNGMWLEELVEIDGVRGPAYYDETVSAWVIMSSRLPEETAANIAAIGHATNTSNKYQGKRIWDTTNMRELRAAGSVNNSDWEVVDGSAQVTPS